MRNEDRRDRDSKLSPLAVRCLRRPFVYPDLHLPDTTALYPPYPPYPPSCLASSHTLHQLLLSNCFCFSLIQSSSSTHHRLALSHDGFQAQRYAVQGNRMYEPTRNESISILTTYVPTVSELSTSKETLPGATERHVRKMPIKRPGLHQ